MCIICYIKTLLPATVTKSNKPNIFKYMYEQLTDRDAVVNMTLHCEFYAYCV